MSRSENGTEESVQDQVDSKRDVGDDCTDGWSRECSKNDSDEQSGDGDARQAEHDKNDPMSGGSYHEELQYDLQAGNEELVAQSFPAGMATPPIVGVPNGASSQASLSFGPPDDEDPNTGETRESRGARSDSMNEPQPPSVRRTNLKRKASDELLGRRSK
ncbi:hypothetical protein PV04_07951 [Phialophora macrospora]|uniref:Uncharacterized protein n=1 Tax=Phialophora macrospora TaxID=1851006 RepID=A0A0D2G0S1_9EURO|nr:hypothetical protein PV04_07951 [Phialophora macrospora]